MAKRDGGEGNFFFFFAQRDVNAEVKARGCERGNVYSFIIWRRVFYWELNHS